MKRYITLLLCSVLFLPQIKADDYIEISVE